MATVHQITEATVALDDFSIFWEIYPKHRAKIDAMKAWKQTEKIRPCIEELLGAIRVQEQSPEWLKDGGAYVPYPASWLRGGRWMDED